VKECGVKQSCWDI